MQFFFKKKLDDNQVQRRLRKDYTRAIDFVKRTHIDKNNHKSLREVGKDFAFIERRTQAFYKFTSQYIKRGYTQDQAYKALTNQCASSNIDRQILESIFIKKKPD